MKYTILFLLFLPQIAVADWQEHDTFNKLLHYQNGKSLVKNNDFFLSKLGKTNLNAELKSLIEGYKKSSTLGDKHPRCLFPDRYFWLNKQQKLNDYEVAPKFCKKLNKWLNKNKSNSVSALFVGGYFDNPASIFGHNLLKFNGDSGLFDLTINYGAKIPENENTISYIFKGLLGGYDARFNSKAFYKQDLVYSKHELRDIWEYKLSLSKDEIFLLKLHIWAIDGKLFDYYFAKENCAYQIASILDLVIDMGLPTSKPWYIPIELTNKISQYSNKVEKVVYRRSPEKIMYDTFAQLSDADYQIFKGIIDNKFKLLGGIQTKRQVKILDLALDYYDIVIEEDAIDKNTQNNILLHRLSLPASKNDAKDYGDITSPDKYSDPSQISFYIDKQYLYTEFSIFNQSLLSNHTLENSELIAPKITFKSNKEKVSFDSFELISIIKLNNNIKNFPLKNYSWNVKLGIKNTNKHIHPLINIGIGDVLFSTKNSLFYFMNDFLYNNDKLSVMPAINYLYKTNFISAHLTLGYEIESKENHHSVWSLDLQKELFKNNSIFVGKNNDNFNVGYSYNF